MEAEIDTLAERVVLLAQKDALPHQLTATGVLASLQIVRDPAELTGLAPLLGEGGVLLITADDDLAGLIQTTRARLPRCRIIALDENDDSEHVVDCLHAGASDFLSLSDPLQLTARLKRLIAKARHQPARRPIDNRFRTLADSAPALVWITDETGSFTHFNRPWLDFTGRDIDHELLQGWLAAVYPEDRERFTRQFEENFQQRQSFRLDFRLLRRDGNYRWITCQAIPHYEDEDVFTGYLGSCLDISDQHEAETLLAYRAITQSALSGFGRFALCHTIHEIKQEATRVLCDTLQLNASEVLLYEADDTGRLRPAYATGLPDGFAHAPMHAAKLRKVGDMLLRLEEDPAHFPGHENLEALGIRSAFAAPIDNGRHAVGFLTGLSVEPREVSHETRNFVQALATIISTVHQRNEAELALQASETKLLQSQKMEAVGQLAGGVAHDFNNLLTAVRCYADMLHDDLAEIAPELRAKTSEILKAAARASALTRQLLAFSRKQVLQPENLDMNAVITDLRDLVRSLLSEDITLDIRLCHEEACFSADRNQIDQVVLNLCLNARDAMQQGGRLGITVGSLDAPAGNHHGLAPGRYVQLSVQDSGIGMDREVQAQLFQPFFTTKPVGRGTGLGLATCAVIVKNCNGVITFDSQLGLGTTFHLFLPQIAPPAFDLFPEEQSAPNSGQEHILVVEDDEAIRQIVQAILTSLGYHVTVFPGSSEAITLYQNNPDTVFDLLLSDVIMPEMNGLELARHLQTHHQPGLRTMFMSGYLGNLETVQAVADYNLPFIEKPFTLANLGRKVRETLDSPPTPLPPAN